MALKFRGINLFSKNPEITFEFYKKLGLRVLVEGEGRFYGAELALSDETEDPQIWIWRQVDDSSSIRNMLVFDSDDLDKSYAEFKEKGITCNPPTIADWGGRELLLIDPDGNQVLFL